MTACKSLSHTQTHIHVMKCFILRKAPCILVHLLPVILRMFSPIIVSLLIITEIEDISIYMVCLYLKGSQALIIQCILKYYLTRLSFSWLSYKNYSIILHVSFQSLPPWPFLPCSLHLSKACFIRIPVSHLNCSHLWLFTSLTHYFTNARLILLRKKHIILLPCSASIL